MSSDQAWCLSPPRMPGWSARLLVCIVLVTASCTCHSLPSHGHRLPGILRSKDTGITHCALEGVVGGGSVTLHMWVRLAQGRTNTSLHVKGFAMLQAVESVPSHKTGQLFLRQAHAFAQLSDRWYLRSPYSNKIYNLTVDVPGRAKREQQQSGTNIREPVTMKANISLSGGDTACMDYELRVDGFKWFCMVLVKPSPLDVLSTNSSSAHNSSVHSTRVAGGSMVDAQGLPAVQRPVAGACVLTATAGAASALDQSSLGPATKVWQLLASYHKLAPANFSRVLWHHYSWHRHMGVHGYILYVTMAVAPLLEEPMIKALVTAGRLHLVLFDDMGQHESELYRPHHVDHYLFQIVILNHMLLAMWNTDSLVVFSDLDEYLLTPQPMTVVQMYQEASNGTTLLAGIRVNRAETRCQANVTVLQCNPKQPYARVWAAYNPLAVDAGQTPHPFTYQEVTNTTDNPTHFTVFPKYIVDPNLARMTVVHGVWPTNNATVVNATGSVVMAHLYSMFVVRGVSQAPAWSQAAGENWYWPADHLRNHTQA